MKSAKVFVHFYSHSNFVVVAMGKFPGWPAGGWEAPVLELHHPRNPSWGPPRNPSQQPNCRRVSESSHDQQNCLDNVQLTGDVWVRWQNQTGLVQSAEPHLRVYCDMSWVFCGNSFRSIVGGIYDWYRLVISTPWIVRTYERVHMCSVNCSPGSTMFYKLLSII